MLGIAGFFSGSYPLEPITMFLGSRLANMLDHLRIDGSNACFRHTVIAIETADPRPATFVSPIQLSIHMFAIKLKPMLINWCG